MVESNEIAAKLAMDLKNYSVLVVVIMERLAYGRRGISPDFAAISKERIFSSLWISCD